MRSFVALSLTAALFLAFFSQCQKGPAGPKLTGTLSGFVILVNSNGAPGVGAVAVVYRVYFARRNHDEGHSHGERPFFIARDIPAFLSRYPGERLPFQRIARDFLVQRALALQDAGIEME